MREMTNLRVSSPGMVMQSFLYFNWFEIDSRNQCTECVPSPSFVLCLELFLSSGLF